MAINNPNWLLFWGLLAALSTPACTGQGIPVPKDEASQGVGHASAAVPSETLAEMAPPKLPKVTCAGNELTISADNSTLASVLTAVHVCIGVQVEIPEGASGSRVFEELGPGPARQVLESLLSGSDFNFVIGSSDANPQKIESVLLMLRPTETASAHDAAPDHSLTAARRAWQQRRQTSAASLGVDESHPAPDETTSAAETDDASTAPAENAAANPAPPSTNDQPPAAAEAPASSGDSAAPTAPTAPTTAPTPESPSAASPSFDPSQSTDQRITDMQQMFQQRRQMNQNQNQNQTQNPTSPQP